MKDQHSTLFAAYALAGRTRSVMTTALASTFLAAQVLPTYATIDNNANAVGTPPGGSATNYPAAPVVQVPVVTPNPILSVSKTGAAPTTALGADATFTDALDTITYTVTVANTGNVTMTNVLPTEISTTFNGIAGTGTMGSFSPVAPAVLPITLAVGASQQYTVTYALSSADVANSAGKAAGNIVNTAGAGGTTPKGVAYTVPPANYAQDKTVVIAAVAKLCTTKSAKLGAVSPPPAVKVGDVLTYTYIVTNCGNVPMTNVSVTDKHGVSQLLVSLGSSPPVNFPADPKGINGETLSTPGPLGAAASSDDATANNGIWGTLAAGASVTFTWAHTVTQAEVDAG